MKHLEFPVEYGVPLPSKGDYKRRYPFRELKIVGASFLVPCDDEAIQRLWNSLNRCAHWHGCKTGWKFTLRRILGGIRVWRVR